MSDRAYESKHFSSTTAHIPPLYDAFAHPLAVCAVKFAVPPGIHGEETSYVLQNGPTSNMDQGVADRLQHYIVMFSTPICTGHQSIMNA